MKVRAISDGFYKGQRRKAGVVFNLLPGDKFSASWMEQVDPPQPTAPQKAKAGKPKAEVSEPDAQSVSDQEVI
jgi:hypothetical protein